MKTSLFCRARPVAGQAWKLEVSEFSRQEMTTRMREGWKEDGERLMDLMRRRAGQRRMREWQRSSDILVLNSAPGFLGGAIY